MFYQHIKKGVVMSNYEKCDHEVGGVAIPIPEKFKETFRVDDAAEKMVAAIMANTRIILRVKNYGCTCPERNDGPHACILKALGCDQVIWLEVNGKTQPFAGNLFRSQPPVSAAA